MAMNPSDYDHYLLFLARSVRHLSDGTPWKYEGCINGRAWVVQHTHGKAQWGFKLGRNDDIFQVTDVDSVRRSGFATAKRAAKALAQQLRLRPHTMPSPYPGPFKLQDRPVKIHEDGSYKGGGYYVLAKDGRFVLRVTSENTEEETFAKWLIMAMNVFGGYAPSKETSND